MRWQAVAHNKMSSKNVATCVFMVLGGIQAGRYLCPPITPPQIKTGKTQGEGEGGHAERVMMAQRAAHGGDCRGPIELMQLKDVVRWAMH